jgi:hypothetical protein
MQQTDHRRFALKVSWSYGGSSSNLRLNSTRVRESACSSQGALPHLRAKTEDFKSGASTPSVTFPLTIGKTCLSTLSTRIIAFTPTYSVGLGEILNKF